MAERARFARWIIRLDILPLDLVVTAAIVLAAAFLGNAIRGVRPVEASVITDRLGEKLVEIYRPGKESAALDYEEFVAALSNRIRIVRAAEKDIC